MKTWIRRTIFGAVLVAANVGVGYLGTSYMFDVAEAQAEMSYQAGVTHGYEIGEATGMMVGWQAALDTVRQSCMQEEQNHKDDQFWFKCGPTNQNNP